MGELNNLSEEDIKKIERDYDISNKDVFLEKRLSNIEKTQKWISVKNNTKTNKYKKK